MPGYRTSQDGRRIGAALVAVLHLSLLAFGLASRALSPEIAASPGSGALSAMALLPGIPSPAAEPPATAAAEAPPVVAYAQSLASLPAPATGTSLSREIAAAVGDDPGGLDSEQRYRAELSRHIARYRTYPGALGAVRAGLVVVRFRIARSGDIVDARIVATQGALLDEAALATLWRAEPLPDVPAGLPVPWEVDIPIEFARSARG